MLKKIVLSIFILFMLACGLFAQTVQTITLKPGFNFIGFIASISSTPTQLKTQNPAIEDIYLFSAAAGSFLSATEGTLSTLAAGKGYIIKSSAASDTVISIPGDAVQTIGNINLKTGFNLIGFSKIPPTTVSFSSLMNVYSAIKGIYKWSPAAGSFIQVVRDNSGVVTLLDGADPSFKAGESYFFNLTEDTTINYDGSNIILGNGPPAPIAKTLELTGTVGASPATASPSYSLTRAIDLSSMQISVYDEINNSEVEGATITATGTDTFKATLPVATTDRYLSVLVKNTDNKVVYKSFLGRVPKATEVTENTVKISNIKVSDESTARAIIVLENRSKIPITAVIAKKSVDASISNTDFALALEERIAGLEDRVPELKQAVNLIANVLTTPGVDNAIKEKVTEFTFSESSKLLSSYISLLQNANTLQTVNNISVPTQLYVGSKQITAQSTQTDIYETVAGINDTIGQRVEMPVLDPPPGSYNSAIAVKMTCDTPNANIIYDYGDGRQGINYTGPVAINKTCKLNVAAFRSDWPMSWHSKFVNAIYTIGSGGGETAETKTLASISLDKTSEAIVFTTEKYNLSNAKITAHYSNGDSKEVQASRWEIVSGPGAFSNVDNSYFPQSKTGEAIFNAVYLENGIEKKIEFKLIAKTQEEIDKLVPTQLTLSKTTDAVQIGGVYDLSKIIVTAHYGDGSLNAVTPVWSIISGDGVINGNICNIGNTAGSIVFKCVFSAGEKTVENTSFTLSIAALFSSHASITPATGGSLILNNGVVFEVPPNSVAATTEVELATLANLEDNLPTKNHTFYKLNTTGTINNATIKIPVTAGTTVEENIIFTCIDYAKKDAYRIRPTKSGNYYLFSFGPTAAVTSGEISLNKNLAAYDNFLDTYDLSGKNTGDTITTPNGVTFKVYKDPIFDSEILKTEIKNKKIEWPHYPQHWNSCMATTWLMLMKGYKSRMATGELNPEFDSVYSIFNIMKYEAQNNNPGVDIKISKDKGVDYKTGTDSQVGKIVTRESYVNVKRLTERYNPETRIISNVCDNFNDLFYLIIKTNITGNPLKVESINHSILVCGYEFNDNPFNANGYIDLEKVYLYVNNPNRDINGPLAPMRLISGKQFIEEILPDYRSTYFDKQCNESDKQPWVETYWDYVQSTYPFVCYYRDGGFTDNKPSYQTIELSDYLNNDGGIKLIDMNGDEIAHTEWDDTAQPPNHITWISGNGRMELLKNIKLKNIPISNSSYSTDVSVDLSVYRDKYNYAKYCPREDIIVGPKPMIADNNNSNKSISLSSYSANLYNFSDNTAIVEELASYVQKNYYLLNDNRFIFRIELKNSTGNVIDRFDVKVKLDFFSLQYDKNEIFIGKKVSYGTDYEGNWEGHIIEKNTMKTPYDQMKWKILTEEEYATRRYSFTDYPQITYNSNNGFSNKIFSSDHCLGLTAGPEIDLYSFPALDIDSPFKLYYIIAATPDNKIAEKKIIVKVLRIIPDEPVEIVEGQTYNFKALLGDEDVTYLGEWTTGTYWERINQGKFIEKGLYEAPAPITQTVEATINFVLSKEGNLRGDSKKIRIIKKL